jgi:signal transduction histidine kinase
VSLRNKLLLFAAALVLVPGVVLAVIAVRSGSDSLQRVIGLQLAREAGHTADRLSSVLRTERQTLANFARQDLMREVRVADIDKRVSMALRTLRDGSPVRLAYLVVDPSRRVVASSDPALIGPLPAWADPSWAAADGEERLLGPVTTPDLEATSIVLTTPIPDPDEDRRVLGTLVGLFDWELMTAVTETVRQELASQGVAADVVVCRPDGTVIGGAGSSDADDASRLAGISDVASGVFGARPDYMLVVEPRSHALAPARHLSNRLVLTMGLALAGALALAALAAGRVVEPLSELTRAIRGLARGDASTRRVPVRTEDEVGVLAGAFNHMASELDQAQQDLVEAEKFAFVGELASGVAHEIRTSLGVLGSSAQILERTLPGNKDEEAGELAQMIRAEVGRLASVVNDLLTLDRARPLRLEVTPISQPVFRAADFVVPQAHEKGVRIDRTATPNEASVSCEPELIYQVAVNLLVNAIQALAEGGCIEVRVLEEKGGYGGFEVRDDGQGIPKELRERIFQPFVTARHGGVGLGLTFVKRVVHDHRGRVSVESEPGAGTCVRIDLPVAGEDR